MQFWTLIVDSFRESLDRKIFWVLAGISVLVALAMLSVGIEEHGMSFMFGMWEVETGRYSPLSGLGRANVAGLLVYILMSFFLGWIGVILMVIATADVFPRVMEHGAVDVLISKPLSRPMLFMYKYAASMVFVLIQATLFVGLTFLVCGLRWGVWLPGYLLSIPLLVLLFSYVYCVTVLVGVKTGSTIASILISLGAWMLFTVPVTAVQTFETYPTLMKQERVYHAARVLSWIPPKTSDIQIFAAKWAGAGSAFDLFPKGAIKGADANQMGRAREMDEREMQKSPLMSIGSSVLFEAVVVLLAMVSFCRRDY